MLFVFFNCNASICKKELVSKWIEFQDKTILPPDNFTFSIEIFNDEKEKVLYILVYKLQQPRKSPPH